MENNFSINKNFGLYSRQIIDLGQNTMIKLSKLKVLIIFVRGLGVEISKNIILSGPESLSIFDPNITQINDLNSNFYLTEDDINNKRRDEAIIDNLKHLNNLVKVNFLRENSIDNLLKFIPTNYDVVVLTELISQKKAIEIDDICRKNHIPFIYAAVLGLTGFIFTDFGNEHKIYEKSNKELKKYLIKNITKEKNAICEIIRDETDSTKFFEKDVIFKNIEGMTELNYENLKKITKIKYRDKTSFYIIDTSNFSNYIRGGYVQEMILPEKKQYKSLKERFENPYDYYINKEIVKPYNNIGKVLEDKTFLDCDDEENIGKNELLFITFKIIMDYYEKNDRLPEINNLNDANEINQKTLELYNMLKSQKIKWFENAIKYDENIPINIAKLARTEIPCITAFLGGIVSQEIIKVTGKYLPIDQWKILDFLNFLPTFKTEKINNKNSRYSDQISIFGQELISKIKNSKILVAGAGALGCEIIKNLSLLGAGGINDKENDCDNQKVVIIDYDLIELSNLNRQFLFHKDNIGESKAICACKEAKKINGEINYKPICEKLCYNSEKKLTKSFYSQFDIVFSCLDNYEGKMYLDNKCTLFEIPSILGGALGPRAKTMNFIPHETACLNDIPESTEKDNDEASCTLRFFPNRIEDCIDWARKVVFEEYFIELIKNIKNVLENDASFINDFIYENEIYLKNKIKFINYLLNINENEEEKILFSLELFNELFIREPNNLLKENPPNKKNDDSSPFWNNVQRPPKILNFDIKNNVYFYPFIESTINILNSIIGYKTDEETIKEQIKDFFLNNNLEKIKNLLSSNKIDINDILYKNKYKKFSFNCQEFNKEDIFGHVNFIHSSANLRAISYSIPECDFNKTFKYVGKISPASINSLATISGYMTLCMLAIIHNKMIRNNTKFKEIKFKSYTLNLIDNFYFIRPLPSLVYKEDTKNDPFFKCPIIAVPHKFNSWEKIIINQSMSIKELINQFKEKYNIDISLIQTDDMCNIYSKNYNLKKNKLIKNDLNIKIEDTYLKIQKYDSIKDKYLFLKISGTKNETKIVMPIIKYYF